MKSIQRRFEAIAQKYPDLSTYICFARTIRGGGFGKKSIRHWFGKLIDPNDYDRPDKITLIEQLWKLSNEPDDGRFGG